MESTGGLGQGKGGGGGGGVTTCHCVDLQVKYVYKVEYFFHFPRILSLFLCYNRLFLSLISHSSLCCSFTLLNLSEKPFRVALTEPGTPFFFSNGSD